jgi:preprotein translocase subunit SecD
MIKSLRLRAAIAIIVILGACIYLLPMGNVPLPETWKKYLPSEKIRLGLDLQGGMHLVLEVDTQKVIEVTMERLIHDLKSVMMENRVRFREVERQGGNVLVTLRDTPSRVSLEKIIAQQFTDLVLLDTRAGEGVETILLGMKDARQNEIRQQAVAQSLETIRNRVDQFGISEPEIIPEGQDRIIVQLPGVKNPERAKSLIGKTALLEFKLVNDEHSLADALAGNIPPDSVLARGFTVDRSTGRKIPTDYLLRDKVLLTGDALKNARMEIADRFGFPHVALEFNPQGARDFERITGENVKRRLAIVLDGMVHSAPVIEDRISGGRAVITGAFSDAEASDLAIVLRAGALPAPVTILEERTVGPSLGQDSIEQGIWSMILGGILVVFFMVAYYKLSGFIANIALLTNVLIIFGVLVAFGATLTLPGLAGIVLVIGMAIDANVLIFERIKEELAQGKAPRSAIETGYKKAFVTILDSNITTLIAALFLFQFGTGPVKGFAVTLTIGIIASLFTAIFITRIIYDFFVSRRQVRSLSI